MHAATFLNLLQLASPALPVGAYSYSEGVETLVAQGHITHPETLLDWLTQELRSGSIRLDAAVLARAYRASCDRQWDALHTWNDWLSALRETEELRSQNWQMGRSLMRLFLDLEPAAAPQLPVDWQREPCNFAIAFAIVADHWQIPLPDALLAYLQSWATNLISAGVRLVPLGQTDGQRLLRAIAPTLIATTDEILTLTDEDLMACNWGLALASMGHETQYSRLFRS